MPAPPAAPVVCEEAPWRLTTVAREPLIMEPALAVAPSGQVDQHSMVATHVTSEANAQRHGMAGFQRRQDAFGARQGMEGG